MEVIKYWIWGEARGREAPQGALAGAGGEAPEKMFVFLIQHWYKTAIENDILLGDQIVPKKYNLELKYRRKPLLISSVLYCAGTQRAIALGRKGLLHWDAKG